MLFTHMYTWSNVCEASFNYDFFIAAITGLLSL